LLFWGGHRAVGLALRVVTAFYVSGDAAAARAVRGELFHLTERAIGNVKNAAQIAVEMSICADEDLGTRAQTPSNLAAVNAPGESLLVKKTILVEGAP